MLFYGKMTAISYRYTGSFATSKDIVHDSFILIFDKISTYSGEGSIEGWVRKVVVNKTIDYLRKKKKLEFVSSDEEKYILENYQEEPIEEQSGVEWLVSSGIGQKEILNAIDMLKESYKVVFNLFAIDGYSHKQISEMLSISEELSRIRLKRARAILQTLLTELVKDLENKKYLNERTVR